MPLETAEDLDVTEVQVLNGSAKIRSDRGRLSADLAASIDGPCLTLLPAR